MTKQEIEQKLFEYFSEEIENFSRQEMIDFYEMLEEIGIDGQSNMTDVY